MSTAPSAPVLSCLQNTGHCIWAMQALTLINHNALCFNLKRLGLLLLLVHTIYQPMKNTIVLLASILFSVATSQAQITSGIVTYDEVVHMTGPLPPEAAQYKDLFPSEMRTQHTLMFTPDASVYQNVQPKPRAAANPSDMEGGTFRVMMKSGGDDDIVYNDLKSGKTIEQTDLFSRKFLIND